jgi:hypothetical protein
MPQRYSQATVNNFVKGLITEAGELTFPEGASVDELNCDLRKDGSRRRRLGVAFEDSYADSSFSLTDTSLVHTGAWANAGGISGKEFLVLQVDSTLYFYNKGSLPYSGAEESFTVDLNTFEYSGSEGSENSKCQFASIKGYLVVTSSAIDSFYVKYDPDTNTINTPEAITHKVRDFEYIGDTDSYFTSVDSVSTTVERKYDTLNVGWGDENTGRDQTAISYWQSEEQGTYPPLTHPWFSGKNASDQFQTELWARVGAGNTLDGNGHFILEFFNKNRSGVSGVSGVPTEIETSRFKTATAFSGRVFYAGLDSAENSGLILFSKLVESEKDFGTCHQVSDPTAEYSNALLDTDGGVINIPECVGVKLLYSFKSSLFIFAENGVWQISGVDEVFSATSYAINRISEIGIESPESFLSIDGSPVWWSRFGIHTFNYDKVSGQAAATNISQTTIQTLWDKIDQEVKEKVVACYDGISKRAYWFYPDKGETKASKLNNALVLDVTLQAFYPQRIEDETSGDTYVVAPTFYSGYGSESLIRDVITTDQFGVSDDVVTADGDDVVNTVPSSFRSGSPSIILLSRNGATDKLTFAAFTSTDFVDWGSAAYTSYAEAGYNFIGDIISKKNAPYCVVYSRLTEEGYELSGGQYVAKRPSSLLVSSAWDFKETFTTGQQAYRLKYPVVVDTNNLDTFGYPEEVVTTRLKIRGHGRSVRLRFESEAGKDFILLGWGMVQASNGRF